MRKRFICMLKVNKTVLDEDFIIIGIIYSRSIVLEVPNWNIYSTINCYFKLIRLATQIPRERKKNNSRKSNAIECAYFEISSK